MRRWRQNEGKIRDTNETQKRIRSISIGDKFENRSRISGAGKKPKFPEIETALVKWVDDR